MIRKLNSNRNLVRNLALLVLVMFVSACTGDHSGTCIRPDGATGTKDAQGQSQNKVQEIQDYLKDAKIISTIIGEIRQKLIGDQGFSTGAAPNMFNTMANSPEYQGAVSSMFILFLVFYGIAVTSGIVQVSAGDAMIRAAKVGFISVTAMNWGIFYDLIASFFLNATDEMISYFMSGFSQFYEGTSASGSTQGEGIFTDLDNFVSWLFSLHMQAIIRALFNLTGAGSGGPYGTMYAILLLFGLYQLFTGIMKVVTVYAMSLFARALLFAIAPIFLAFLLFQQTKTMFDGWLKQLVNYSLEPVLVTAFLGLFISLIQPLLLEVLQQDVCYLPQGGGNSTSVTTWTFVEKGSNTPLKFDVSTPPPLSLETTMMFLFFCWLFGSYINIASAVSKSITMVIAGNLGDINTLQSITRAKNGLSGGLGGFLKQ